MRRIYIVTMSWDRGSERMKVKVYGLIGITVPWRSRTCRHDSDPYTIQMDLLTTILESRRKLFVPPES